MKSLPKKLLPLTLFGIAVTSLLSVQPAQAFTMTVTQNGANVVWTGSGAFNLTGLTQGTGGLSGPSVINASIGEIAIHSGSTIENIYSGFTGPGSFGSGGQFFADSFSGDFVTLFAGLLLLPQSYISGHSLSDSMTFNNATFTSLGVTPGTYTWTWGSGLPNQNFTLIIGRAGVPDGGSTVSLLGCALLGLAALRHKLGC